MIIGSLGALVVWWLRLYLPESPRWLAQRGQIQEAERIMRAIEARVEAQSGRLLPPPRPAAAEDPRVGRYRDAFSPEYRGRTVILIVANLGSTIGFYGFANWVPMLLIAKGIHVTQSLEYTFLIALAYPIFALSSVAFADRMERKWQAAASSIGMTIVGLIFSMQTAVATLIVLVRCRPCS